MIAGIRLKVCGLTSAADARAAAGIGADWLGFIFHPQSPRGLETARWGEVAAGLPEGKKVAVVVEPEEARLADLLGLGFDAVQVHFRPEVPPERLLAWSRRVGKERLWLAPRLPAGAPFDPGWLPLADTFLLDGYDPDKFGGTGRGTDLARYIQLKKAHPDRVWILSGGLGPANSPQAVRASGASFIDVNSGVESAPGRKDGGKLAALAAALLASLS